MKIERNQKYFTIARYATFTIVISALVILAVLNFDDLNKRLSFFTNVAKPIIIGIFCAYLLNPLMIRLENGMFGKLARSEKHKDQKKARALALTTTMLFVLAMLILLVMLVLPQLSQNIIALFDNLDAYTKQIHGFIDKISAKIPFLKEFLGNPIDDLGNFLSDIWNNHSSQIMGFAGNIASGVLSVLDAMKNIFIGLTISIYLLAKKEMFIGQSKKLVFAFMKPERAQRFLGVCREASKKFLGSIIGKIVEAFFVGVLIFVVCWIAGIPYAPLISAIMFLFNLIPYVGPIIGAVPCGLLLLMSSKPSTLIWFIVIICVIQTLDGNVIAPWILGDSTGLPAVWILISLVVGGGLFGMLGMLLSVPVCAVLYMLFKDFVENKLRKKNLPQSTALYVGNVDYITSDYVYAGSDEQEVYDDERKEKTPQKLHLRDKIRKLSVERTRKLMGYNKTERREKKLQKESEKIAEKIEALQDKAEKLEVKAQKIDKQDVPDKKTNKSQNKDQNKK